MIQIKHTQSSRILVVEPEPQTFAFLEAVLHEEGFTLLPRIKSLEQLLQQLPLYRPNLMIISLDLEAGEGIAWAKKALKICPVPLIYIAGHADKALIEQINETGPMGLILKPLDKERVISSVSVALYKGYLEGVLKAQEALLNSTLSSIPDAILTVNRNHCIRYVNQAAEHLLKKSAPELIGQDVYEQLHLRDIKTQTRVTDLESWLPNHVLGAGNYTVLELVQGPQQCRLVEARITHTHDANNARSGIVIVLRDVQEQFLSQETIRMMAGALENQADAVMVTKATRKPHERPTVVYVNRAFEALTGWRRHEILGRNIGFLSSPSQEDTEALEAILQTLSQGQTYSGENILLKKDASRFVAQQVAAAVLDEHKHPALYTFALRDVTELHQLEARIRSTQRLEAIGRLAGGFAHDFNNLVSIITSYADLLKIQSESQPTQLRYLNNIQESCSRAETLVSQLMAFSQRDIKAKQWLNLTQVVQDSQPILARMLPPQLKLTLDIDPDLPSIEANRSELEQSLLNLAQNAAEAMAPKGSGTITLKTYFCDEDSLPPGLLKKSYICLEVRDTGHGIPKELKDRLFEPFSSTKEVGQGAGLGLAYVYGVVKQSGGDVLVESVEGQGATFRLYFPIG